MSLSDMAKRANVVVPESNEDAYAKAMIGYIQKDAADKTREEVYAEVRQEMRQALANIDSKVELIEKSKSEQSALHEEFKSRFIATNDELKSLVSNLTNEINEIRVQGSSRELDMELSIGLQRGALKDVETRLADSLGQLRQAEKQIKELRESAKQMPMPLVVEKPIPSFEFKPVKDMNGNIVKVIATPIGG